MLNSFSGQILITGLIVLLWYEINLFHYSLILPLTSLNWNVLDMILVLDILPSIRDVCFTVLSLEWG